MLDYLPIEILLHISSFLDTKSIYYLVMTGFTFLPIIDAEEKRKRRTSSLRKFNPLLEVYNLLKKPFDITCYGVLRNPCITYDIVLKHINNIKRRNIKYHLIHNPNFNLEMIIEIYNIICKENYDDIIREYINYSPNISYELLNKYKSYIIYDSLSLNQYLPDKFIIDNPDLPWNRNYIILKKRHRKQIDFIPSNDYEEMSKYPNLPFEYIKENKDKSWNIELISMYNYFGYI